jgi:hypothetical protein
VDLIEEVIRSRLGIADRKPEKEEINKVEAGGEKIEAVASEPSAPQMA